MGASVGRISDGLNFVRQLLEGKREERERPVWLLDSLEKVMLMWPTLESVVPELRETSKTNRGRASRKTQEAVTKAMGDAIFAHLRRLFRCGFRTSVDVDGLRLRQFFSDGEVYRPDGYSSESVALIAHMAKEKSPLRIGQCRVAPAGPVLRALGFADLAKKDSYAIQFAWVGDERWVFVCERPELFRREIAATVAAKLTETERLIAAKVADRPLEPSL